MIGRGWLAWRRLLAVWLPVVLFAVANLAVYVWLSSETIGRKAALEASVDTLQQTIARLEKARDRAADDRRAVEALQLDVDRMYDEVFASLDDRLTAILRAVGDATREAGVRPATFSYSATEEKDLGLWRFQISFAFEAQYRQVRRLLDALAESPQFLIVDRISFTGDEDARSQDLRISLAVSTYLARADKELLDRLTSGQAPTGGDRGRSSR
jgi:Tfp pilus assembly protein PilO